MFVKYTSLLPPSSQSGMLGGSLEATSEVGSSLGMVSTWLHHQADSLNGHHGQDYRRSESS